MGAEEGEAKKEQAVKICSKLVTYNHIKILSRVGFQICQSFGVEMSFHFSKICPNITPVKCLLL